MQYLLLLVVLPIFILQAPVSRCCSEEETAALLQLKAHLISISSPRESFVSTELDSWSSNEGCCWWKRVECHQGLQHVTHLSLDLITNSTSPRPLNFSLFEPFGELISLDLSHNSITGLVPYTGNKTSNLRKLEMLDFSYNGLTEITQLGSLTSLKTLLLDNNNLIRTPLFPTVLCELQNLQELQLQWNSIQGNLPLCIGNLTSLRILDISHNGLGGSFPTFLLNTSSIEILFSVDNSFEGVISLPEPRDMTSSLRFLDISQNNLSGFLPKNFDSQIPTLRILNASMNHFEGSLPTSLGNLSYLKILDFSNNNFSGEFTSHIFQHCPLLEILKLSNNHLQGDIIPRFLNATPQLYMLLLDRNHFTGTIEDRLPSLGTLDISYNEVSGVIPSWIGNISYLSFLSMSDNQLKGQIPIELCNPSALTHLDLSNNGLTGGIPSCFNQQQLWSILLHNNFLSGPLPDVLPTSSSLRTLSLGYNLLSGGIPPWIGALSQLRMLLLGHNSLGGIIPKTLCQSQLLNIMDLSNNDFYGEIPSCIASLSFGVTPDPDYDDVHMEINAAAITGVSSDSFPGVIDAALNLQVVTLLTKSTYYGYQGSIRLIISVLDLSCNRFTGNIPEELGELGKLQSLNLSHNELSGSIPAIFSMLTSVESLDLSYNKFTGAIPSKLALLTNLEIFNVSYNNLSGNVPELGQFADFDESNYMGNLHLCGFVGKSCKQTSKTKDVSSDQQEDDDGFDWVIFLWSFGMSSSTLFVASIAVLWISPQCRRAWFRFADLHILWWL